MTEPQVPAGTAGLSVPGPMPGLRTSQRNLYRAIRARPGCVLPTDRRTLRAATMLQRMGLITLQSLPVPDVHGNPVYTALGPQARARSSPYEWPNRPSSRD